MFQLSIRVAVPALALVPILAAAGGAQGSADGELGADDFRISSMGPDGDPAYAGTHAAVAYDSSGDRYLVVWQGDDTTPGELEVYGQLLDHDGVEIGEDFRISSMGPEGDPAFLAARPSVAYGDGRFLVVWEGSDALAGELEIHAQFLDTLGNALGGSFLVSSMGPDGDTAYDALAPDVAYNDLLDEHLVVWAGADTTPDEFEIYAQRVQFPLPVGKDDYRVSTMGVDGDASIDALEPALAALFQTGGHRDYAVAWHGDATQDGEFEIYYQQLSVEFGHIGPFQPRISDTGPPLDPEHGATCADIVSLSLDHGTTLVVWQADEGVAGELEIHGQRVNGVGLEIGLDDFRISTTGVDGDPSVDATHPASSFFNPQQSWEPGGLVAWMADVTPGEKEIVVQTLDPNAILWGPPDVRISSMGPDGSANYAASSPTIAARSASEHLVAWHGEDDAGGLAPGEQEIFGQRYLTVCTDPGGNARRNAGSNPQVLHLVGAVNPQVGKDILLAILAPSGTSTTLFAFETKTSIAFPGGQVLLCFDDLSGELLTGQGLPVAGPDPFAQIPVPGDTVLCGFEFTLQALFTAPAVPFVLSNAVDLTVGL